MLLMIELVNKLTEHFLKKNCKKQTKKNLELKKYSKEKVIKYTSNKKDMIIHSIAGLVKKT